MINLRSVEAFYAVMRTGSVTQAARLLNVTQPAVSIALQQLERRLRLKLFDRVAGRLIPTVEARALLPDTVEIFGRLNAMERLSQDLAQGVRGSLSIAATPPLCDGVIANSIASFLKRRPNVNLSVQAIASAVVVDRVISGEVDVGVVYEPVVSAAVQVEEVSQTMIGCLVPSSHRLARRRIVTVDDLAGERIITYLPQALLRPYVDRLLTDLNDPLRIQVLAGQSSTVIALALERVGIALIESSLFMMRPRRGFVLRPMSPEVRIKILVLRSQTSQHSHLAKAFIKHLREVSPSAPIN